MSVQAKRKNRGLQEENLPSNVKKRKNDLAWLSEGLNGPDPFAGNYVPRYLKCPIINVLVPSQSKVGLFGVVCVF